VQCAVDGEHPFEDFQEPFDLHVRTIVEPRVGLRAAAEAPLNGAVCRQGKGLCNERAIALGSILWGSRLRYRDKMEGEA